MAANDSAPPPSAAPSGGTVEPEGRAPVTKDKSQVPLDLQSERYELRDPFAEVTYRSPKLEIIIAKAKELGATRFSAIAEDGVRTPILKVGSTWLRGDPLPVRSERPLDLGPANGDRPDKVSTPPRQTPEAATQPSQFAAKALAKVELDAERAALVRRLETALNERYIIKQAPASIGDVKLGHTEYRFRGDTSRIAFTESTFRLATDMNSPSVARSMVDVAQARGWKSLRVSGSEDFRRLVWLEASVRGVKALGYEPNPADLDVLRREQQARQSNRIEPTKEPATATAPASGDKSSARGGGGRKAIVAAIESVLVSRGVSKAKLIEVLAATQKLMERARPGQVPRVKVFDKTAPPQRAPLVSGPEPIRTRERQVPALLR